jgi:molecular chaperone GrpE
MMPKTKKSDESQNQINELTADLQRTRADFENYRKRVDGEIDAARQVGRTQAIVRLLPVIDNIERAIGHMPEHLRDDTWAQGVASLVKNLDKSLEGLGLVRVAATPGTDFNPDVHEAISMDEDAEGDREVIVEELQAGYVLDGRVVRHSMVRVGKA